MFSCTAFSFQHSAQFYSPKRDRKKEKSSEAAADERGGSEVLSGSFLRDRGIRSERKQNLEVKLAGKETAAAAATIAAVLDGGRSRMFLFDSCFSSNLN